MRVVSSARTARRISRALSTPIGKPSSPRRSHRSSTDLSPGSCGDCAGAGVTDWLILRPPSDSGTPASEIEGPPEIPARHRTIGAPAFGAAAEHQRVHTPTPAERTREALPHPEIAERQHIRPPQPEEQEHLHRPATDAAHRGKAFDDLLIGHPPHACHAGDRAVEGTRGEILNGDRL